MTIALGLLAAAVLIGVFAPTYLRTAATPSLGPRIALAGWISASLTMIVAALGAATLFAIPRSGDVDGLIGMTGSCLNILRGGDVVADHVGRVAVIGVVGGLLVRIVVISVRRFRSQNRWRTDHVRLLRTICAADESVLWVQEPTPVAYSVGGRGGAIVATDGLRRLGTARCEAVLAHERAHLHGRHHLLVIAADILAAALPFVPLTRQAPAAVRALAELAADAAAARRHGPDPVRSALITMSAHHPSSAPDTRALGMARDAITTRLTWLAEHRPTPSSRTVRSDYALGVALTAVPVVLAVAGVTALVTFYCLTL